MILCSRSLAGTQAPHGRAPENLQSGVPRPHIPERDPFALRAIVALLFVTASAYSLSPNSGRIADAFHIRAGGATAVARVDAG